MTLTKDYIPYGVEWEKEMTRLPKAEIIKMLREAHAGTTDSKVVGIMTLYDANHQVEGIINDYEGGIIDKPETMRLMGEYTGRLMSLFWENAKKKFKLLSIGK